MALKDEFRRCGWCLESPGIWIAEIGGFGYCLCDPCLESLGDGIVESVMRARWAKEITDAEDRLECPGSGR